MSCGVQYSTKYSCFGVTVFKCNMWVCMKVGQPKTPYFITIIIIRSNFNVCGTPHCQTQAVNMQFVVFNSWSWYVMVVGVFNNNRFYTNQRTIEHLDSHPYFLGWIAQLQCSNPGELRTCLQQNDPRFFAENTPEHEVPFGIGASNLPCEAPVR